MLAVVAPVTAVLVQDLAVPGPELVFLELVVTMFSKSVVPELAVPIPVMPVPDPVVPVAPVVPELAVSGVAGSAASNSMSHGLSVIASLSPLLPIGCCHQVSGSCDLRRILITSHLLHWLHVYSHLLPGLYVLSRLLSGLLVCSKLLPGLHICSHLLLWLYGCPCSGQASCSNEVSC